VHRLVSLDEAESGSVRMRLRSSEGWKAKSKPESVFTAVIRAVISAIFTRRFWRSVSSSAKSRSMASAKASATMRCVVACTRTFATVSSQSVSWALRSSRLREVRARKKSSRM